MASATSANASNPSGDFVVVIDCPDQPGIVHAVARFLFARGGNIVESQQFFDRLNGRFFMRIDFTMPGDDATPESLREEFHAIAQKFEMSFEIWGGRVPYRTLIMVSKQLHCLNDLLFRHSNGSLQIDIPVVVSNHPDAEPLVRSHGIEFRHIPVTPETKADAEAELMALHEELGIHLVVLARYMQVLSDDVCRRLSGTAIVRTEMHGPQLVDRFHVVAVHFDARKTIRHGLDCHGLAGGLAVGGDRDRPVVVLADEDHRHPEHPGEVHRHVEVRR